MCSRLSSGGGNRSRLGTVWRHERDRAQQGRRQWDPAPAGRVSEVWGEMCMYVCRYGREACAGSMEGAFGLQHLCHTFLRHDEAARQVDIGAPETCPAYFPYKPAMVAGLPCLPRVLPLQTCRVRWPCKPTQHTSPACSRHSQGVIKGCSTHRGSSGGAALTGGRS